MVLLYQCMYRFVDNISDKKSPLSDLDDEIKYYYNTYLEISLHSSDMDWDVELATLRNPSNLHCDILQWSDAQSVWVSPAPPFFWWTLMTWKLGGSVHNLGKGEIIHWNILFRVQPTSRCPVANSFSPAFRISLSDVVPCSLWMLNA